MKIIEITPPTERRFTIEVSEKELEAIGILAGSVKPSDFEIMVNNFQAYNPYLLKDKVKEQIIITGSIYTDVLSVLGK
jgi:hypothetical protein